MNYSAAAAWTIQGKKQTIDKLNDGYTDDSPGPVYNTSQMGIKTRCISYSPNRYRRTNINEGVIPTPSPDKYNPQKPALIEHSTGFAQSIRANEETKNQNPDPCMYIPNDQVGKQKAPEFSMGSKYPSIMDNTGGNPGPGDYPNPQLFPDPKFKTKKSMFGTQKRFSEPTMHKTGVGQYNISNGFINNKGSISKADRFIQRSDLPPAPGHYEHVSEFNENNKKDKGKTMGTLLPGMFNENKDTADAFNNYLKEDKDFPGGKSYSLGKQKRQIFPAENIPAPTDYFPEKTQNNRIHAVFPRDNSKEYNDIINNPGPGHYPDKIFRSTQYTIPKSKSISYLNRNPGAGRYDTDRGMGKLKHKYKNQSSGPLFCKSNRTNFIAKNIAGVGDYDILQKKMGGVSIPKAKRFPKPNENPGPGDYHFQSTISNFTFYRKK